MGRKRKEPGEKAVAFSFSTADPEVVAFLKGLPSQGLRSYLITQLLKQYIQNQNGQGVLSEMQINIRKPEVKREAKIETVEPVKQYIEPVREVATKSMQEAKQNLNQEVDLLEEFGGLL